MSSGPAGRTNAKTAAVAARNPRQPFVTVAQQESERERERAGEKVMKREEDQEMGEERVGGGEEAGGKCPHSAAFRVRDVK